MIIFACSANEIFVAFCVNYTKLLLPTSNLFSLAHQFLLRYSINGNKLNFKLHCLNSNIWIVNFLSVLPHLVDTDVSRPLNYFLSLFLSESDFEGQPRGRWWRFWHWRIKEWSERIIFMYFHNWKDYANEERERLRNGENYLLASKSASISHSKVIFYTWVMSLLWMGGSEFLRRHQNTQSIINGAARMMMDLRFSWIFVLLGRLRGFFKLYWKI